MFRKRRRVTPGFQIPPPFNPIEGNFADLQGDSVHPYCALFQVAADDTYQNYVICRGFDPRTGKFIDYRDGDPNSPGISVAKPYGARTVGTYNVGEIYPALLPTQWAGAVGGWVPPDVNWRVGQTPGEVMAGAVNGGHPADLLQPVQLMADHKGELVNWMIIDGGKQADDKCEDLEDIKPGTYRGIAGAMTAPGETGPVIVTGCDGDVTIDAVNHSGCTFYLGDRISVHIDPCCVAHFDGCSAGEPAACESNIYVCVGGDPQILAADGGTYTWDMSTCCDCESAELDITLSCTGTTIEADWEYRCGGNTDSGTIDISGVFNLSSDVYQTEELAIVNADCEVFSVAVDIQVVFSNVATDCATCLPICCECAGPAVKGSVFGPEFQTFPSFICEGVQYTFTMDNHNTNCTWWPNSVITFESGDACRIPTIHSHNFGDITTDVQGNPVPRWRCAVDGTPPSTFTVVASFTLREGICQANCLELVVTFKDDLDPDSIGVPAQFNTVLYAAIPCEEGGGPGEEGGGPGEEGGGV